MPKFGKVLAFIAVTILLFFFSRPVSAQESYYFQEEFNQERPAGVLDTDKWVVYPNQYQGCLIETVRETGGILLLKQCSGKTQFPYVVSKNNPIPNGDFSASVRFQFPGAGGLPTGIKFVDTAPANGAGATELFGIGFEEDIFQRFIIEYKDSVVFTKGTDSNYYIFKAIKEGNVYKLFLNDQLVFTSPETSEKVKAIYMGNPAILQSPGYSWSWPRIDYIRVINNGSSEITPQPFLNLPWDYGTNGMSFNEAATSINAYFDHEYPLLSSGLPEPPLIIRYLGPQRTNDDYSSHDGYDYGVRAKTKLDTPVLAPADGEATFMSSCGACGNAILIDHKNGYQTRYYHLQPDGLITNTPGQKVNVSRGQQIGKVGYTGNVDPKGEGGSHLHFMVIQDKNKDGNFEDNIPDGITDPFGWQSSESDPWENYSFNYAGAQRTGSKSYYLFTKKLDNLNATLTANQAVFNVGKTKLEFPQGATDQNLNLLINSAPNFIDSLLNSLGSIIKIEAKNAAGDLITTFLKNFSLTINFSQFDLSRFNLDTLSIYSSPDGENWTKENTSVDLNTKTASASLNHLTYFALMAERTDTIAPVTTPVLEGEKGIGNNFRSGVKINLNAIDNSGGLGTEFTTYRIGDGDWQTYTTPPAFADEGNYKIQFYSQDKDGNLEETKSVEFLIDKTPPQININSPKDKDIYLLNQTGLVADYSCSDEGGSGLQSCQGTVQNNTNINTQTVGANTFTVQALDNAGNKANKDIPYKVQYSSNGLCNSEPGHAILQPINPDGTSIFKQGSTVPIKFRVCDINGIPISESTVKSFNLIKSDSGTSTVVNEPVISTTPDQSFRYDLLNKQWIFNMSTRNLSAGKTYFYQISLNDLTDIKFSFGLR